MKILMLASECYPFIKVGGLADVLGALVKGLSNRGNDVRLVLPKYKGLKDLNNLQDVKYFYLKVNLGRENVEVRILEGYHKNINIKIYFIEYDTFYSSNNVYLGPSGDDKDNGYRFALYSKVSLELCRIINWHPDIIHCHDWPTGLVPAYLNNSEYKSNIGRAASVLTIHNLQHQGYFNKDILDYANLPDSLFNPNDYEAHNQINFLKGAILNSSKITTVSPTYAKEIKTIEYGCGLEDAILSRSSDVIGIINGVDTDKWNPKDDDLIISNFSSKNLEGKIACKKDLQKIYRLEEKDSIPLFVIVTRLYEQKGMDLLLEILDELMNKTIIQLAILGTGDPQIEKSFVKYSDKFKKRISIALKFDEKLAHKTIAGGDFLLMPSRFEPCGLTQIYSMIYGTIPIVRKTGGLNDTVSINQSNWDKGNGFGFDQIDSCKFYEVIMEACEIYNQKERFNSMKKNAMRVNFEWDDSVIEYEKIYLEACLKKKQ